MRFVYVGKWPTPTQLLTTGDDRAGLTHAHHDRTLVIESLDTPCLLNSHKQEDVIAERDHNAQQVMCVSNLCAPVEQKQPRCEGDILQANTNAEREGEDGDNPEDSANLLEGGERDPCKDAML